MSIALNWKAIETALVHVAFSSRVARCVKTFGVSTAEKLKKLRQVLFAVRMNNEVPVMRHQFVGENHEWSTLESSTISSNAS